MEIENEASKVRRLGEERDDVAVIIDSGANVALFSVNMADHGEGELIQLPNYKMPWNRIPAGGTKSAEISLRDIDGREVLLKEHVIFSSKVNQLILCCGRLMEHGWGINGLENGDLKVPFHSTCKIAL